MTGAAAAAECVRNEKEAKMCLSQPFAATGVRAELLSMLLPGQDEGPKDTSWQT